MPSFSKAWMTSNIEMPWNVTKLSKSRSPLIMTSAKEETAHARTLTSSGSRNVGGTGRGATSTTTIEERRSDNNNDELRVFFSQTFYEFWPLQNLFKFDEESGRRKKSRFSSKLHRPEVTDYPAKGAQRQERSYQRRVSRARRSERTAFISAFISSREGIGLSEDRRATNFCFSS